MNLKILDKAEIKEAKNIFDKIFKSNSPFEYMYTDYIEETMIVFRTNGYFLTKTQFEALKELIKLYNEKEYYISIIEYEDIEQREYYILDENTSYQEYINMPIYLENAIYSKNQNWAVMVSHEEHAVIGASKKFIDEFKKRYINYKNEIEEFKLYWNKCKETNDINIEWIKNFI